uniref:Transmembrane p24 trafficking protein 4 n=1 Tax=Junco hyemalis TaxID=40217 RepID=A0A8C5IFM3_JUNHY
MAVAGLELMVLAVRERLLLLGWGAHGLYFHIGETEKRCFIEEIPDETMVIGNYRTQLWDKQSESFLPSTPGLGMHVEVKDPDGKVVMSRQYGSEGRFTFTSHTPGEHQICLHSNSTRMALFAGGKLVMMPWHSLAQPVRMRMTVWAMDHQSTRWLVLSLVMRNRSSRY